MPDRLAELRRQRELLREHAAWLDREIAAAEGGATVQPPEGGTLPPMPVLPRLPEAPSPATPAPPATVPTAADADALLKRFGSDPATSALNAKRGCWAVFGAALLLLFACVLSWYLIRLAATAR